MNLLSCETPEDYFNHGVAEEEKQKGLFEGRQE